MVLGDQYQKLFGDEELILKIIVSGKSSYFKGSRLFEKSTFRGIKFSRNEVFGKSTFRKSTLREMVLSENRFFGDPSF